MKVDEGSVYLDEGFFTIQSPFLCVIRMGKYDVEDIKDEMLAYVGKHSLSHKEKMELAENTSDEWRMEPWEAEDAFSEVGSPICAKDDELFMPKGEVGSGTSTYTSKNACQEQGGKRVGHFHTHPTPPITPSNPDLRVMQRNEDKVACIGSIYDDDVVVACFKEPESEWRGAEMLEAKRMIREGPFGGRVEPSEERVGEINIWEDRKPTPRQILEERQVIIEDASKHTDTPEEEIKETLRDGRIPDAINRLRADFPVDREYEEVDLPVYSSEDEEDMLEDDINELKSNFDSKIFVKELKI